MSLFATSNATTQSKVHHSEYLITDSDPNGLRMTSSRISKLATQQRIAASVAKVLLCGLTKKMASDYLY